jgi:wyosine [tRNA(Phe)-imidazoG37] synthetase (radical SAM superfamily)
MGQSTHIFGPVPSRRLGRSLGVDIVPLKVCTQNCIYCQLGIDAKTTLERKEYVPAGIIIQQLRDRINEGLEADYITFSGSGEPTLNSAIGRMIDAVKALTDIPIAIITNGTLLSDPGVRADCAKADLVVPSLDAGDDETFHKINAPNENIDFDEFVEGMIAFRKEYAGKIWLEVFFSEGINTSDEQIEKIKAIAARIAPDKIQLNTAVRPTTSPTAVRVSQEKMNDIAAKFGPLAEVAADFSKAQRTRQVHTGKETILEMLRRRPCTLEDICAGLDADSTQIQDGLNYLLGTNEIKTQQTAGKTFYAI